MLINAYLMSRQGLSLDEAMVRVGDERVDAEDVSKLLGFDAAR